MKALGRVGGGSVPETGLVDRGSSVVDLVFREAPVLLAFACSAAVLFSHLAMQFAADSWLNLLGGREIVAHGLPRQDTLAVWSHGQTWIDQQWLANLFYYGVYAVGGLTAAARANVLVFLLALAGVLWFARSRGGGPFSVAVCSIPMLIVGVEFIRAQVLAELLEAVGDQSNRHHPRGSLGDDCHSQREQRADKSVRLRHRHAGDTDWHRQLHRLGGRVPTWQLRSGIHRLVLRKICNSSV